MDPVPAQYKTIGVIQLVCGLCNVMFGWAIGYFMYSFFGGLCTGIMTLGLCPFGLLCGFLSFLILPLGVAEIVVGALTLAQPESVRGAHKILPLIQIPSILLGNFISPIMGGIVLVMTRDPEVAAYLEGS